MTIEIAKSCTPLKAPIGSALPHGGGGLRTAYRQQLVLNKVLEQQREEKRMVPQIQLANGFLAHLWRRQNDAVRARVERLQTAIELLAQQHLSSKLREQIVIDAYKVMGTLATFGAVRGSEHAREIAAVFKSAHRLTPPQAAHLHALSAELKAAVNRVSECLEIPVNPAWQESKPAPGCGEQGNIVC
jgi:hypothetical protein